MELNTSVKVSKKRSAVELSDIDFLFSEESLHKGVEAELIDEAGEDVFKYLSGLGCLKSRNIMLLSSVRHYLYDSRELEKLDTLINLRVLNGIKHMGFYLQTMNQLLPIDGLFIGCFVDYAKFKLEIKSKPTTLRFLFLLGFIFVNRIIPRIPVINVFQAVLSHGKAKCLTSDEVKGHLANNGFQILNMAQFEGLTFFVSKKIQRSNRRSTPVIKMLNDFKTKSRIINV